MVDRRQTQASTEANRGIGQHAPGKQAPPSSEDLGGSDVPVPTAEYAQGIESTIDADGSFKTEVKLLSLAALRRVADHLAGIVATQASDRPVVLGALPAVTEMGLYASIDGRLGALTRQLEAWKNAQPAVAQAAPASVTAGLSVVTDAVTAAAKLVSYFKVETKVTSADSTLEDDVVRSVVSGALVRRGVAVRPTEFRGLGDTTRSASSLTERLLGLLSLLEEAGRTAGDDEQRAKQLEPVSLSAKALSDALLDPGSTVLQRLATVEATRTAAEEGSLLLAVSVAAAGGTWRTRKSLWTTLFTGSEPKFTGGTAVSFTLTDLVSGEVQASDVLYAYMPATTIGSAYTSALKADNLDTVWAATTPKQPADATGQPLRAGPRPPLDTAGTHNAKYRVVFQALAPGGFYSADPDDLSVKRSIRTNNPGALNVTSWQRAFPGFVGQTRPDGAGNVTSIYRTPEHGIAAWYNLLAVRYGYGNDGQFRIGDLARRYAGAGSEHEASVRTYVAGWRRHSGNALSADSVIHLGKVAEVITLGTAMFGHEIGAESPIKAAQIEFAINKWLQGTLPPN